MSGRHALDSSMRAERLAQRRRRATSVGILGAVLTVLGVGGLVLTEPATLASPGQPRAWAVAVVVVGLGTVVASLLSRASPATEDRPRRPSRPGWLLLLAAACGLLALVASVAMGSTDPLAYLGPVLLTVYPLALYAYRSWRHHRFVSARMSSPRRRAAG